MAELSRIIGGPKVARGLMPFAGRTNLLESKTVAIEEIETFRPVGSRGRKRDTAVRQACGFSPRGGQRKPAFRAFQRGVPFASARMGQGWRILAPADNNANSWNWRT